MAAPPQYLLIENVVGFEASETREALIATLRKNAYHVQELELSPEHFGVPYSRPRYFALCRKRPFEGAFTAPFHPAAPSTGVGAEAQGALAHPQEPANQVRAEPLQNRIIVRKG